MPVPAPALAAGLSLLTIRDKDGSFSYLLGRTNDHGWWYYFPVVFFFKTPLPFLALAAAGVALMLRRKVGIEHALIPVAILLAAMTASINVGVRHVLPMYAWLSVAAAYAAIELWRMTAARPYVKAAYCALVAWLLFGSIAAHPDYLAYFNEAAGSNPAHIAVDSNLDWGQDIVRLERVSRELKIEKLWVLCATSARFEHHDIPADGLPPHPVSGWIAAGETALAIEGDRYQWLTRYEPVRRVGKSIRLYYLPEQ